nr:integrase, catalytic region, zinc finger, CCHC-type, peptidase aspartic, catalytic [Tanacetum cinerariifolium]
MYTRRIVIQRQVEDLQLGVESYQKKLNLTKPDTYRSNLRNKAVYTSYSDPHGIIYVDQYKRKILLRADELHKFSDGTLNDVRSTLHDIDARIKMEYLPMRKWSNLDKKRAQPEPEGSPKDNLLDSVEVLRIIGVVVFDIVDGVPSIIKLSFVIVGIDNDIYSTVDAYPNAYEMWKAIERLKQEPTMVTEDDEMSKDEEIDKLLALISLSFKKIYKPTNNNLRNSSNTSRENQDNSPRISRGTGYENQKIGNVAGARETIGTMMVQKSRIQCYNYKEYRYVARECQKLKRLKDAAYHKEKMLLYKQDEAGFQLNAKQVDWKDDTDDEPEDQELEAHYIEYPEQSNFVNDTYPIEQDKRNVIIDSLDMSYDREQIDHDDDADLANEREIEDLKTKNKSLESSNNHFKEANNELSKTNEWTCKDLKKFQDIYNDVKMKKELFAHQETISILSQAKEAQLKFYKTCKDKEIDKVIVLENKIKDLDNIVYKTGQSVQTMNMLNRNCKMSFAKPEFLKKAQSVNPHLFDIGCYNDNLALMLAPESDELVEIILFIVDSGCSNHITRNLKLLTNFVEKFLGTVKLRNDQIAPILCYGDLVQGAVTIKRVYYVKGMNHNLFSVGQFYDADLEVAFWKSTCYIRDLKGNDLLTDHVSSDPVPQYPITALEHDSLSLGPQCLENVPHTAGTVTTSNELDLLFSPMFDELLNGSTQVVLKSSAVTTADTLNQCQQQNTTPLNTQSTPGPTCQVLTQAQTVTSTENINQSETISKNAQGEDDEFINIFCTPTQDRRETSSQQVIRNPSQSVRTRRQLESDGEICGSQLQPPITKTKSAQMKSKAKKKSNYKSQ